MEDTSVRRPLPSHPPPSPTTEDGRWINRFTTGRREVLFDVPHGSDLFEGRVETLYVFGERKTPKKSPYLIPESVVLEGTLRTFVPPSTLKI